MQHFICTGRLCDNPSITQGQKSKRAYFQIAISRDIRKEGAPDADFLNCVAFKDRADFVEKYLRKGMKIEAVSYTHLSRTLFFNTIPSKVFFLNKFISSL